MSLAFLLLLPTRPGRPLHIPTGWGWGGGRSEGDATGPRSGPVSRSTMTPSPVPNASQRPPNPHGHPSGAQVLVPTLPAASGRGLSLAEGHGHLVGDRAGIRTWVCVAPAPML